MDREDSRIDLETAFARFQALRGCVEHRPWNADMPMERALDVLSDTLGELRRAEGEIRKLRERVSNLKDQRDRARRLRSQLEERLVAVQKLEAVGRLAGGIAHDFNNILQVVMGRAQLLLDSMGEGERNRKHAREIRTAGQRAAALARQLLAFSRPKARYSGAVDGAAVIAGMREMLELVVGRGVSLELCLDAGAGSVAIERGQLEQIIINLVMNARDAMPGGGVISISMRRAFLRKTEVPVASGGEPGEYMVVTVADTGIGMDRETRARIFDPYFTTKDDAHGTGLGLARVQCLVSQSRGWIAVETSPGAGSRFEIFLPSAVALALPSGDLDRKNPCGAAAG